MFGRFIIGLFLLSTVNVSNGYLCCMFTDNKFLKHNASVFEQVDTVVKIGYKESVLNIFEVLKKISKGKYFEEKSFFAHEKIMLYNDTYIINMSDLPPPILSLKV